MGDAFNFGIKNTPTNLSSDPDETNPQPLIYSF
jgi:hypothetical protein